MSWNRILLPVTTEPCPDTVAIGKLAWDIYYREQKPAGFAMFHASIGGDDGMNVTRVIYFTPVASSLCGEIAETYPFESCEPPFRDERNIAFVFGDPLMMGHLREPINEETFSAP